MKDKLILLASLFILHSSFAQITYGEIKKREVLRFRAPKPYDSLNDFYKSSVRNSDLEEINKVVDSEVRDSLIEKLKLDDYKKYIGLDFFLADYIKYKTYRAEILTKNIQKAKDKTGREILTNDYLKISNDNDIYNKYYTVIDIKNNSEIENEIESKIQTLQKTGTETSYIKRSDIYDESNVSLTLVKKNTSDTLYVQSVMIKENFTLVPYFIKMKKLYDGKVFLAIEVTKGYDGYFNKALDETTQKEFIVKNLSRWTCEVTLLKEKGYSNRPQFVFKNDEGKVVVYNNQHSKQIQRENYNNEKFYFITETEYAEQERLKKINTEQLRKEKVVRENAERIKRQKLLEKFMNSYGNKYANLIMENEVEIGMSKEMCLLSWGQPYDISTIKTEGSIREILNYSYQKTLFFENGNLVKIEY